MVNIGPIMLEIQRGQRVSLGHLDEMKKVEER
jgi:hypothetical protein